MKYNTRVKNNLKFRLFRKLVEKNHQFLQDKTGYFSVFLNDTVSNAVQVTRLYESEILIPLFEILSDQFDLINSTAIDVGANIGNHTIFFSEFFKKVLSFEPNPITYKVLSVNTYFLQNVEVHNFGLSDTENYLTLSVSKGNIGGSSASINYNSDIHHQIKVIKLDDFKENVTGNIALIKIDVEGMEKQVLMGAKNTINNHRPIILFELWSSSFENGTSSTVQFLENAGYLMYILTESHYSSNKWLRRLKRIPLMITNGSLAYTLLKPDTITEKNYSLIIAIHNSRISSTSLS